MPNTCLVNGRRSAVNPTDRGLAYGDGLFETMAARHGRIRWLEDHLDRLERGCGVLGIECPERSLLRTEIARISRGQQPKVVKLILTRGPGARGYRPPENPRTTRILSTSDWPAYPSNYYTDGLDLGLCNLRVAENPKLAGIKHLNRLEQVLAQVELAAEGFREGLMLSVTGTVVGGTMSNIFAVTKGCVTTPLLDRCGVHGIMRSVIMGYIQPRQTRPIAATMTLDELLGAQELFMTNSIFGVWPVRSLAGRRFDIGTTTLQLMRDLEVPTGAQAG